MDTICVEGVTFTSNMKKVVKVDYNVERLELPDSVVELAEDLCRGHHNLKEVVIPSNVRVIPRSCFGECDALDTVSIPKDSHLFEIDSFAFKGCKSLDSFSFPSSMKVIGYMSFAECINLKYIVFDFSINRLKDRAFQGCENLKDIYWLDSNCVSIGDYCFKNCKSITSIDILESIKSIGVGAFEGCSSLQEFDCQSPYFEYSEGCLFSIDKCHNKTLVHKLFDTEELFLTQNVVLKTSAYAGNLRLTKIDMPECITHIPSRAFYGCKNVKSVNLSKNLVQIEEDAFSYCESLETIDIPRSAKSIGKGAFMFCKNLKNVTVPGNIRDIESEVFASCDIRELVIEEGVEVIGGQAFGWNKNLRKVCLPKSVKQIDYRAFINCPLLEEIVIHENCKMIANDAFELCNNLKRIVVPTGTMSFYKRLIPNYSHLLKENPEEILSETDSVTVVCPNKKRLTNYEELFCRRTGDNLHRSTIQRVIVPEGVECLGASLFKDCVSLVEVILPDTLQTIGDETFSGCTSLRTIRMPRSLKRIGSYAFQNCVALQSISIPEGIVGFPEFSCPFMGCSNLEHIDLPESFSVCRDNIFRGCRSLSSVSSPWFVANEGAIYTKDLKTLVAYTSGIRNFIIPEGVTIIGKNAFCDSEVEKVSLPSTLLIIKDYAFSECSKLADVQFRRGLKRIEKFAFDSCDSLKVLDIPEGVTYIGSHAITIADSAIIRLPRTLKKWEDSEHGGPFGSVTRYIVPHDKVEYYKEFFANHVHTNQNEFVVEARAEVRF